MPKGNRTFDLTFVNILYAAGVQEMTYSLRTLKREQSFMFAEQVRDEQSMERAVVIEKMTREWARRFLQLTTADADQLFDEAGSPDRNAFLGLVQGSY